MTEAVAIKEHTRPVEEPSRTTGNRVWSGGKATLDASNSNRVKQQ